MKTTRVSPAHLVVALALMLAMGGVGYAAGSLPKNSVGSKQLKANAVKSAKIKNNSVTGVDVSEQSLLIPGTKGSLLLSGFDFRPLRSAVDYESTGAGDVYVTGPAGSHTLTADLEIPVGAKITSVRVYYVDDAAGSVSARVSRYTPTTLFTEEITGELFSEGASSAVRTLDLTLLPGSATVTAASDYRIAVQLPLTIAYRLTGAKVDYAYTARLD